MPRWEIVQPDELDPYLDALAGRSAGIRRRLAILAEDPCDDQLRAYRLSGPLAPKVCGLHLDRGYRLAFTTQPPLTEEDLPRVVLLYVGKREPGHRDGDPSDVWDDLHDLFDVGNPPAGHHKPPCCDETLPGLDHDELERFLKQLKRFRRGR